MIDNAFDNPIIEGVVGLSKRALSELGLPEINQGSNKNENMRSMILDILHKIF